jgi:hypothetical protein
MFHMANDSHLFRTSPASNCLPVYEGKMIYQYDHRFSSYESLAEQERAHMLPETPISLHQDPSYSVMPCYYVAESEVNDRVSNRTDHNWLLGLRDVTINAAARSVIFAILPRAGIGHKIPLVEISPQLDARYTACLLGSFNSLVLDYVARQKLGGSSLSYFILKQLPMPSPATYEPDDLDFIVPRVMELSYTAWDLKPFAEDCGYDGPPFRWDEEGRALLRAELDAYYAALYGLTRDELRYILDPSDVYGPDFPGETFRVLKNNEIKKYGEYRTQRLVLEAWDKLGLAPRNRAGRYDAGAPAAMANARSP